MKNATHRILAIAVLILPSLSGCQTMKNESMTVETPIAETTEDAALSKSVRDRLVADKKADLTDVTVVSGDGTVYLSGTVKTLDARQQAIKIAWEVHGVQSVVNRLEVEK